jgi:6-phosphogluconolactonase
MDAPMPERRPQHESESRSPFEAFRPRPAHGVEPYYAVDDAKVAAPPLPGKVIALETVDELIDRIAADMVVHAENCVRQFGDFHLALSGGSTPQPLYERLMYDPNYRRLPWRRTHLWMVDERCVPFDDPASNYRAIDETIVDHADIPREQVHPMLAMSEDADEQYEKELRETLAWREKGQDRLDFVLLGMGADGHTASLFPHSEAQEERTRLIRFNTASAGVTPAQRVTMTYPIINSARFVAVLVTGKSKAEALQRVASRSSAPAAYRELPILGVKPTSGELRWYLDADACGLADQ